MKSPKTDKSISLERAYPGKVPPFGEDEVHQACALNFARIAMFKRSCSPELPSGEGTIASRPALVNEFDRAKYLLS